jgi:hypothetical protein
VTDPEWVFLFKLREADGEIDVYKVPHGRTVAEAKLQANGATHTAYTHGQAADESIDSTEIRFEEMGLEGMWAKVRPSLKLSMKKLWDAAIL